MFFQIKHFKEHFEITSLVGTVSPDGSSHLHVTLGRFDGTTVSGHVMGDMKVFTTAEILLANCSEVNFDREFDPESGYKELSIKKK